VLRGDLAAAHAALVRTSTSSTSGWHNSRARPATTRPGDPHDRCSSKRHSHRGARHV